tara:strand:+ start:203 stop:1354 length:1152 start_codon:yes stop_codon:yes gene_type:complete
MGLTQVNSEGIKDGEIKNADIKSDAAIDLTKLNSGSLPNGIAVNQQNIAAGQLVTGHIAAGTGFQISNSNVSDNAAIALSKLASTPAVLTGSTNNTITTVTGANAIQGEANLTFDGNNLSQTISSSGHGASITTTGNVYPQITLGANRSSENNSLGDVVAKWNGTKVAAISFTAGPDTTDKDDGKIGFDTRPSGVSNGPGLLRRMTITSTGDVEIPDGNLVIGTSGHGIDFSATSDASGKTSELLDDYEEGTFTPTIRANLNTNGSADGTGSYVKVGKKVTIHVNIGNKTLTSFPASGGAIRIDGLPFNVNPNVGDEFAISSKCIIMGVDNNSNNVYFRSDTNQAYLFGYYNQDGSTWAYHDSSFYDNSGVYVIFNMTYFTNS